MAQTKFFRGVSKASLPNEKRDGAIYIIDSGDSDRGEMYVDISRERRLQISPSIDAASVQIYTKDQVNNRDATGYIGNQPSETGKVYLITDTITDDDNKEKIIALGIKIGGAGAYIADLPLREFTSEEEKQDILNRIANLETNALRVAVIQEENSNELNLRFSTSSMSANNIQG